MEKHHLHKIYDWLWEIPRQFRSDMRVPARVYASEKMLEEIVRDRSLEQLVNVATLPGIESYALVMPDAHEGYGFPIGGVAAFDAKEGVISPGGVGYDINCGVRLLRTDKTVGEIRSSLQKIGEVLYREVPSGVGRGGRLKLKGRELEKVLAAGAQRMLELEYATSEDTEHIESRGRIKDADPSFVSQRAKQRGSDQLGTMGAGNHFVEVQRVESIFDSQVAEKMGLFVGQITVMIHTGSRGLGHQVATDFIRLMMRVMPKYGIVLPDRELACAPCASPEGKQYFSAMACAANFAWANRQLITWEVRKAFEKVLGRDSIHISTVYDVAHNMAKVEDHAINEKIKTLVVHRKGATRAFPDQPVLIPGSMGTASYVLVGTDQAMHETFGSSCHGAGRRMSRTQAKRMIRGASLREHLAQQGIVIATGSISGLAEEAPQAYKDVDQVVEIVHQAGIARKVARLTPLVVVKG